VADQVAGVGVATGLGWMPTGGDLIFIESRNMPGKGDVKLTGQVGDVMDESARTALSWVRSHAEELGIEPGRFAETDLHVHVPAGAVRKDGPSAGVAMATALVSLFSGRPVRPDVAMTGEVTLRGLVLPVGGIKGKVLAAHRAGIHTVLLPARNREDLADVPEEVRRELDIRFVSKVGEALEIALGEPGDRAGALDAPPSPQQPGPATRPGGDQRPARVAEA
jgi:ATP-dependent Lon protease